MKILALQRESHVALGVQSLSVAARITEVLDFMESNGLISFTAISESDPAAEAGVRWADAIILSKHSSQQALGLVELARKRHVRVVYDIDDWIFSFPSYSGGLLHNKRQGLIREIIGLSDVVTVANTTLQAKMRDIVPDSVLVPNGMWIEKYVPCPSAVGTEANPPSIVFTNADFLKMQSAKDMLMTALQVFFMRHPEFVLDFYGDPFPEMFSLPFLHFTNRLPYADYMRALVAGRYQFAITPLGAAEDVEAHDFNSCKNPFKYLNYGAAKVPGLYSRAPIYSQTVTDGNTGVLVDNDFDSWLHGLERMAGDIGMRNRIRAAAFDDVMERHHIRMSANVLMEVLKGKNNGESPVIEPRNSWTSA